MTFDTRAPLAIQASRTINVGRGRGALPTIVWDGFESADMSAPDGPAPYLNRDGFTWGNNNRTSVVTKNEDGNVVVWNNGPRYNIQEGSTEDWTPKTGDYCLRFRYPPGENMAEQRWTLQNGLSEVWSSFWVKVPENYYHPEGNQGNQKFFAIWMDGYEFSGDGPTVVFQLRRNGSPGDSRLVCYAIPPVNTKEPRSDGDSPGINDFISHSRDQGRWMQIIIQCVSSTDYELDDGIVNMWRRWEDESEMINVFSKSDYYLGIPSGEIGFRSGYLMGWANTPYTEETNFLLDDFKLSETNLIGG